MVEIDEGDSELARYKHQVRLNQLRIAQLERDVKKAEAERDAAVESAGRWKTRADALATQIEQTRTTRAPLVLR